MSKLMILITGMPGSGKSIVTNYLHRKGYRIYSMGDIIRKIADERGVEKTPENLLSIASEIREKYGLDGVAKLLVRELPDNEWPIVIDGVRSVKEIKVLSTKAECVHLIAVHASPKTRFTRLLRRGRPGDPRSWEDFVFRDKKELEFGLGEVISLSDTMIINESSIENVLEELESNMERIMKCEKESEWRFL